jgi:putative phosphoribosyl transferase
MPAGFEDRRDQLELPIDGELLAADLYVPDGAPGLVVFAHGSGWNGPSARRNLTVIARLAAEGFATLQLDMLSAAEAAIDRATAEYRFDITLLARRLVAVTDWACETAGIRHLPIGYYGASTAAAAALLAAATRPKIVACIVSRGGRPDLAGSAIDQVGAATMLIVGESDLSVLDLNRRAFARLRANCRLALVPGAGHLFQEPGALEQVTELALVWFATYLMPPEKHSGTGAVPAGSVSP